MPLRRKDEKGEEVLTRKEEAFVATYLSNGGNGFQAAKAAGYSIDSAYAIASENLRKPEIARRIQQRIAEATTLTPNEIIGTLASQMRADMTDCLDEEGNIDLDRIKQQGLGHLVKRLRVRRTYEGSCEGKLVAEVVDVELHDAQAAAAKLASLMGLQNWGHRIDINETKRRIAVTLMAQELLNNGWTLNLALSHMLQLGISAEDLKLINGDDLKINDARDGSIPDRLQHDGTNS